MHSTSPQAHPPPPLSFTSYIVHAILQGLVPLFKFQVACHTKILLCCHNDSTEHFRPLPTLRQPLRHHILPPLRAMEMSDMPQSCGTELVCLFKFQVACPTQILPWTIMYCHNSSTKYFRTLPTLRNPSLHRILPLLRAMERIHMPQNLGIELVRLFNFQTACQTQFSPLTILCCLNNSTGYFRPPLTLRQLSHHRITPLLAMEETPDMPQECGVQVHLLVQGAQGCGSRFI